MQYPILIPRQDVEALAKSLREQANIQFVLGKTTPWENNHHTRGVSYANAALQAERLLAGEKCDGPFPPMDFYPVPNVKNQPLAILLVKLIRTLTRLRGYLVRQFNKRCFGGKKVLDEE